MGSRLVYFFFPELDTRKRHDVVQSQNVRMDCVAACAACRVFLAMNHPPITHTGLWPVSTT